MLKKNSKEMYFFITLVVLILSFYLILNPLLNFSSVVSFFIFSFLVIYALDQNKQPFIALSFSIVFSIIILFFLTQISISENFAIFLFFSGNLAFFVLINYFLIKDVKKGNIGWIN